MQTTLKARISGSLVEVFDYGRPIIYGEQRKPKSRGLSGISTASGETADFSRQISTYRTKSAIRGLISSNAYQWKKENGEPFLPVFGTFTFADNVEDVTQANKEYTHFIQRLNYATTQAKVASLRYLNIVEFQKRGAVHYHTLFFNLPYIDQIYDLFLETWGNGWSKVDGLKNTQHISSYVTKYLTKLGRDERLDGRKAYFGSRGLKRPLEFRNEQNVLELLKGLGQCSGEYSPSFRQFVDYSGRSVGYSRYKFSDYSNAWVELTQKKHVAPVLLTV